MATYVISDIHGACGEFQTLLRKIHLSYTGRDSLYLLGDFGDWGSRSMETILFVKELDETYDFVHCLMGNHEQMFVNMVDSGAVEAGDSVAAANWLVENRGAETWKAYREMPPQQQRDLYLWMKSLPLSVSLRCGSRVFMLGHAYPYFYDQPSTPEEAAGLRFQALWRRLELHEDPFFCYHGQVEYDYFVCGHTIADVYMRRQLEEAGQSLRMDSNRIFFGERFIDIDCGAKCMDLGNEKPLAAQRARLSALCLDDLRAVYVAKGETL